MDDDQWFEHYKTRTRQLDASHEEIDRLEAVVIRLRIAGGIALALLAAAAGTLVWLGCAP